MESKALSVRQPWATLIVCGVKGIEIRSWSTAYRGRLFIHASKTIDQEAMGRFQLENPPTGSLIGTVELIGVEPFTRSTWEELSDLHLANTPFGEGLYAWRLANAVPLAEPINCRGERSLFAVADFQMDPDVGIQCDPGEASIAVVRNSF